MLFQGAAQEAGGSARSSGTVLGARNRDKSFPHPHPLAAGEPPLETGKRFIGAVHVNAAATRGLGTAGRQGGMSDRRLHPIGIGRWLPSGTALKGLMAACFLIYFIIFKGFKPHQPL